MHGMKCLPFYVRTRTPAHTLPHWFSGKSSYVLCILLVLSCCSKQPQELYYLPLGPATRCWWHLIPCDMPTCLLLFWHPIACIGTAHVGFHAEQFPFQDNRTTEFQILYK